MFEITHESENETTLSDGDEAVTAIDGLVAAHNRALLDVLDSLGRIEVDGLWERYGTPTLTDLLTSRYGVSLTTARDWQRIGALFDELPHIRSVFARGRLSWEQLREVTKLATQETDNDWAAWAQEMTPAELRAERRPPTKRAVDQAHRERSLRWWFDETRPQFHLTMTCPDAEGAVIATALGRLANQADPNPEFGVYEPYDARCADALWQMASQAIDADSDSDRATVVVTASLEQLLNDDILQSNSRGARIVDGPALGSDTLRRLLCDSRLQLVPTDGDGQVVGVGRTMRTPPPGLRRVVLDRDNGCRFPRCQRDRWVHVHHLVHWAHGGPTDLDNLMTLCAPHHRLIHEGGWSVSGDPNHRLTWIDRHGLAYDPGPPTPDLQMSRRIREFVPDIKAPDRPPPRVAEVLDHDGVEASRSDGGGVAHRS